MLVFTIPSLISLSVLFTRLTHPLAMGLVLLTQTILISLTVGFSTYSFWVSYILFLVFLGGMLVLFIYVASIASNEPFFFVTSLSSLIFFVFLLSMSCIFVDALLVLMPSSLPSSSLDFSTSTPFIISWIYNTPSMSFTIFIISYLLLMLIVVVKIVSLFKGPLRLIH
uniref:NADH-ubiquinone oxidoreductase chain 6 n=1 Tax=Pachygrapsus crassipes TaxID=307936 RepID=S4V5Q9_PACCR|nr:NADH dehydrogenase subunit 6 [Pachygrapsus crassipes]AGO20491.1 NADH dehydrogenase subunit 6 [Pachygrapsus crassipes]